jgi:hypothetical protein
MNGFYKYFITCLILFFFITGLSAQPADTIPVKKNSNYNLIKLLEDRFSVKIFYDPLWIEKQNLNPFPASCATPEEALNILISGKNMAIIKIQESDYSIVPAEIVKNIIEQRDTLLNSSNEVLLIGNINDYNRNKTAEIRGTVSDGKTGEPIVGATVIIKSLKLGVITDSKGFFKLSLNPGNYSITITNVGFEDYTNQIKVLSSGNLNAELFEKSIKIEEIIVASQKANRNVISSQMSIIELDKKMIKQLPPVMGEKDLIKSFSMLPGVTSSGEFGTGISVRGGGSDQNLFLLDETPIYNTSHVFGLISAFSPDVINNVTLYKGFIPADYGERVSSIIDIQLKNGNDKAFHANGGIGLIDNRLSIEGPIVNNKVSFIVGGRSSYSDWLLADIPDAQLGNSKANFYDFIIGVNANITEKQRLSCFFYNSYDYFNYDDEIKYSNTNYAGEIKWNYYQNSNLYYSIAVSYSDYGIEKKDLTNAVEETLSNTGIYSFSLRSDMVYNVGHGHVLKTGVQAINYHTNPGKQQPLDSTSNAPNIVLDHGQGWELAYYLSDDINLTDKISVNAGLRYSLYLCLGPGTVFNYSPGVPRSVSSISDTVKYANNSLITKYYGLEPRVSLKYQFGNSSSTKISYTRNIQYISLISTSAVQTPDDIWEIANKYIKPVLSNTIALGYYKNLEDNTIETNAEIYYRTLDNLTDYINGAELTMNSHIETELVDAQGKSYGAEIMIKKNTGFWDGWLSYTYSRSFKKTNSTYLEDMINNNNYYPSSYDKPNDFNMMLTYHANRRLRFSWNFTYSTGRPVTLPIAMYETDGTWKVSYGDRNSQRLPDYNRLDFSVSLDESLKIKKKWKGSWTFSVLNVYARKNAYSVFFQEETPSAANDYRQFGLYKLYIIGEPFPTLTYNFIF